MPFAVDLSNPLVFDLFGSLLLLVLLLVARLLAVRLIRRRAEVPAHLQRRWIANVKNLVLFVLVVGLVLIWAPQLRTLALSLTAVAVAIVVATKELILCISGSVMRASSRAFSVGDWIEVAGLRGEVTDHSLFVTTLQELGGGGQGWHYTGRTVVVPNSVFLSAPIRNHNLLRSFTFHTFALTVEPHLNLFRHEAHIRSVVERHVAPFRDEARRANAQIERRSGVDLNEAEPSLTFGTTDMGRYRATITLFVPTAQAEALEHAIVQEIMAELHDLAQAEKRQGAAA